MAGCSHCYQHIENIALKVGARLLKLRDDRIVVLQKAVKITTMHYDKKSGEWPSTTTTAVAVQQSQHPRNTSNCQIDQEPASGTPQQRSGARVLRHTRSKYRSNIR